jgi:hypothetical protein
LFHNQIQNARDFKNAKAEFVDGDYCQKLYVLHARKLEMTRAIGTGWKFFSGSNLKLTQLPLFQKSFGIRLRKTHRLRVVK